MSKILVLGDIHQDTDWASKILEKELSNVDKVIFLGDYFDTRYEVGSTKGTCDFLEQIKKDLGLNVIFLVGNHDINYYYHYHAAKTFRYFNLEGRFQCSGASKNRTYNIGKYLSEDFILNSKLAHFEDDVLYSHAGARPELFEYINGQYDIDLFIAETESLWRNWNWKGTPNHKFFNVGVCRGGHDLFGGLTWCDFNQEHWYNSNKLPIQVCGHSGLTNPGKRGNIHCIDCRQTWYAIVDNGQIEYKNYEV